VREKNRELRNTRVNPTIAVSNIKRARIFYEDILGLIPVEESISEFGILYECGGGTTLYLYLTGPHPGMYHPANFTVENIEEMIETLSMNGVVFEQYDFEGMKTNAKGVAVMGNQKLAWFKDPDGNILSLLELVL